MPSRRPLRYRGIRISSATSRILTRFWVGTALTLLAAVGVIAALGRSDGRLPVPMAVGVGLLWAAGIVLTFRRKRAR
jgi:hypothetical protein